MNFGYGSEIDSDVDDIYSQSGGESLYPSDIEDEDYQVMWGGGESENAVAAAVASVSSAKIVSPSSSIEPQAPEQPDTRETNIDKEWNSLQSTIDEHEHDIPETKIKEKVFKALGTNTDVMNKLSSIRNIEINFDNDQKMSLNIICDDQDIKNTIESIIHSMENDMKKLITSN